MSTTIRTLTTIILVSLTTFWHVDAAKLNATCMSNSGCEIRNSNCKILAPTCGAGTCACIPGFQDIAGQCRRKVLLGFACNPSTDSCVDPNAECVSNRCTCSQGYKQGLKGYDCISNLKSERFNAKCFDTVQCYYNMVCLENRCQCYPGFKSVGDYDCIERQVGDTCLVDDDCSRAPNTHCINGVCDCIGGFKRVQYLNADRHKAVTCINQFESPKGEGELCNVTSVDNPIVCKSPFVCLSCSSSKTICTRPTVPFSGAVRLESLIALTAAAFATTWALLFDC